MLFIFVLAMVPTLANQPLYFITDDIAWLSWAQSSQGDSLNFMSDAPGTGYRPLVNFIWFYGYSFFGVNGLAFQLLNGLFFAIASVYVYRLVKLLGGEVAGIISAILFIALDTSYVLLYWSAYITTTVELLFMAAALFYIIRAWERRNDANGGEPPHETARVFRVKSDFWERVDPIRRNWVVGLAVGITCALLAYMAKEMSLVLIPLGLLAYALFSYRRLLIPRFTSLGIPVALGILSLVLLFSIYPIGSEAGGGNLARAGENLTYYLNLLFTIEIAAPILIVALGYLVIRRIPAGSTRAIARIILILLFIFTLIAPTNMEFLQVTTDGSGTIEPYKAFNPFSILILMAMFTVFIAGDHRHRTGIIWFIGGLGLLLFLGLDPQATYLQEPLIGLCLVLGIALRDFTAEVWKYYSDGAPGIYTIKGIVRGAFYLILILAVISQVSFAAYWAGVANTYGSDLVDLEDNFREAMEDLAEDLPPNVTLFGYEYDASFFPSLLYGRIYHISSLGSMMPILGRPDITVMPISFIENETVLLQYSGNKFVITYVLYYESVHNHPDVITAYQQYAQGQISSDDVFGLVRAKFQSLNIDELWILRMTDPAFYTYVDFNWPVETYTIGRNTILVYTIG